MTPLQDIGASALGEAMRHSDWLFPAVKAVHLTGVGILVGSIAVIDLRLLGLRRSRPLRQLARRFLPWTIGSFLLIVPSGLMMFVAQASELVANPVFAAKFALILAAFANAGVFHAGAFRSAAEWDVGVMPPAAARLAGAFSLALWVSVIACGRAIA